MAPFLKSPCAQAKPPAAQSRTLRCLGYSDQGGATSPPRRTLLTISIARGCRLLLPLALLALVPAGQVPAQQALAPKRAAAAPPPYQRADATPLPADRGASALAQDLRRLRTRASLLMVVAHPDDEDGGMLAYESRVAGADTTLLTLTRGEGGQNLMSADFWDQLGQVRTQELLAAGRYYGVHQFFTRVADFGFSKTLDESLKLWGHDRVLYDCVRVVRLQRPLVVNAVFAGNVSDGHGQHQVSGVMAQEVYKLAGDPTVFPDQIAAGLLPWSPRKVYARVPFARATDKGIYDYATGHYEPVRFKNYATGAVIDGIPSTTVEIPEGTDDPVLGRSPAAFGRLGLNEQKSQNGGKVGLRPGSVSSPYHLYATRTPGPLPTHEDSFFDGIDTSLAGIAEYAPAAARGAWEARLRELQATVTAATSAFSAEHPERAAPDLARGLAATNSLLEALDHSTLPADARYNMRHELDRKRTEFNQALLDALGLSLQATVTNGQEPGPAPSSAAQTTPPAAIIGQPLVIAVHLANAGPTAVSLTAATLETPAGGTWRISGAEDAAGPLAPGAARNLLFQTVVPTDATPTEPFFSRPTLEQAFYDLSQPRYLSLPEMPYPLSAYVRLRYAGVEVSDTAVVQVIPHADPTPEPLLVAPAISVAVLPRAGVLPLGRDSLPLAVTVHSSVPGPATGQVHLELPAGWSSSPATIPFRTGHVGEDQVLHFQVKPTTVEAKPYEITAVADVSGHRYQQDFETVGYKGLRPYPYVQPSTYRITGTDVHVAPGLRVGYVMGTGDAVPQSLEDLDLHVTALSAADLARTDLSGYNAIVLGIRTYAAYPELAQSNQHLLDYVHNGGVVLVQYQTPEFDHNLGPFPLSLSGDPEKVVEEDSAVQLAAGDPLLAWPNRITPADFNGWVEERGHGFLRSWDPRYVAPTEVHDAGQDPQRGGLVYTRYGKGAYIYLAFAFFREMPEGVPGSFRIMANLLSFGKNPALATPAPAQP